MTKRNVSDRLPGGHRVIIIITLCLFGLCLAHSHLAPKKKKARQKVDERVYLVHADKLTYDQYGVKPDAQILAGKVQFRHKGATLTCDSAHFFEMSNSFEAFGHVFMKQGDTLTLNSDYAFYDGNEQMAYARYNVLLTHRKTKLYTDSLDYDRLYNLGYFFEGGKMVDKNNVLTSDWGQYDTESREAVFNYDVRLTNPKFVIDTDTLYYDTRTSMAHVVGMSKITSGASIINTDDGYYNTNNEQAELYGRSTLTNKGKSITGDSLYYDEKTGIAEGFKNVVYVDTINKNEMHGDYFWYNDQTGYAFATKRAVVKDFSQKDTLYLHGDTLKMYTYNMDTDSVWRKMHCYYKVRAYRRDVQAVCDSLVYSTKDSCMTMYKDPITWNGERQLLGEVIHVYMKDSTIERAHINGQAFSIEKLDDKNHYNQVSSKDMFAYFIDGNIRRSDAIGNVLTAYYQIDEADSTLISMTNAETDTMRLYMENRKLDKVWTSQVKGIMYPITQIPPAKLYLPDFAWFDYVRPLDKDDIFEWRGKAKGTELKEVKRHAAPLQKITGGNVVAVEESPEESESPESPEASELSEESEVPEESDKNREANE